MHVRAGGRACMSKESAGSDGEREQGRWTGEERRGGGCLPGARGLDGFARAPKAVAAARAAPLGYRVQMEQRKLKKVRVRVGREPGTRAARAPPRRACPYHTRYGSRRPVSRSVPPGDRRAAQPGRRSQAAQGFEDEGGSLHSVSSSCALDRPTRWLWPEVLTATLPRVSQDHDGARQGERPAGAGSRTHRNDLDQRPTRREVLHHLVKDPRRLHESQVPLDRETRPRPVTGSASRASRTP